MMKFIDLQRQYRLLESDILKGIQGVLEHGQYIMGPEIAILEEKLAHFVGARYAVANASGTDALLMALLALGIGQGDEVITTPFSFFATVEVIMLCGATPIFVDIDPETYNIDPALIEAVITPKTRAIIPVGLYGQCADMKSIHQIGEKHKVAIIEDAAQSFGATHHGVYSCAESTIACTSFFPSKPLGGYGDSGACFTNDDALAQRLKEIRIHGQSERYRHHCLGINGRMDTIQAAILIEKLKLFPEELKKRHEVAANYEKLFAGTGIKTPKILPENTSAYAQYTIEVDERDSFQKELQKRGIPTMVHYPLALHLQEAVSYLGYQEGAFPHAERASKRVLSLPMHPYLSYEEQKEVVSEVVSLSESALLVS